MSTGSFLAGTLSGALSVYVGQVLFWLGCRVYDEARYLLARRRVAGWLR